MTQGLTTQGLQPDGTTLERAAGLARIKAPVSIANGGTAATTAAGARAALLIPNRNLLINGCMRVSQRGTTFNATTVPLNSDDTFLLDRWNLLSDGNDIVDVTQDTTVGDLPTGAAACIRLDVETANKEFGMANYLEYKDARAIIGGNVSLSFKALASNARIGTIRAAILSWSSTADTLTSDFVSAWNAGANITPIANWTIEGSAQFSPTTSWATYKLENVAIDTASTANVAVFIWCDDETNNVGDFLYITDVQLEKSAVATDFENRHFEAELAKCQRYYNKYKSPGNGERVRMGFGMATDTKTMGVWFPFPCEMRDDPTLGYSAVGDWIIYDGTNLNVCNTLVLGKDDHKIAYITAHTNAATAFAIRDCVFVISATVGTEWMDFSSEL